MASWNSGYDIKASGPRYNSQAKTLISSKPWQANFFLLHRKIFKFLEKFRPKIYKTGLQPASRSVEQFHYFFLGGLDAKFFWCQCCADRQDWRYLWFHSNPFVSILKKIVRFRLPFGNILKAGRLATLLEGAGYFSIISNIQNNNFFNFNGEKCVVGYKFSLKSEVRVQWSQWYQKSDNLLLVSNLKHKNIKHKKVKLRKKRRSSFSFLLPRQPGQCVIDPMI